MRLPSCVVDAVVVVVVVVVVIVVITVVLLLLGCFYSPRVVSLLGRPVYPLRARSTDLAS